MVMNRLFNVISFKIKSILLSLFPYTVHKYAWDMQCSFVSLTSRQKVASFFSLSRLYISLNRQSFTLLTGCNTVHFIFCLLGDFAGLLSTELLLHRQWAHVSIIMSHSLFILRWAYIQRSHQHIIPFSPFWHLTKSNRSLVHFISFFPAIMFIQQRSRGWSLVDDVILQMYVLYIHHAMAYTELTHTK